MRNSELIQIAILVVLLVPAIASAQQTEADRIGDAEPGVIAAEPEDASTEDGPKPAEADTESDDTEPDDSEPDDTESDDTESGTATETAPNRPVESESSTKDGVDTTADQPIDPVEAPDESSKSASEDVDAQDSSDKEQPDDTRSADGEPYGPALPEGMSLDDVLDVAAQPPPADFPAVVPDDRFYAFLLGEQLEYRARDTDGSGHVGLEWQAWAGGDYNKVWLKTDAEGAFVDETEIEAENDLLYSRLITPFWNLQAGAQYALGWAESSYEDRWSAALALQGMAPGAFEVDGSVYLSEDLDVTAVLSLEYDIRITQRLVFQPHAELGFSAQEIPERNLGIGLTDLKIDTRLRYEFVREFAPYLGTRYRTYTFESADLVEADGEAPAAFFVLAGVRFAI